MGAKRYTCLDLMGHTEVEARVIHLLRVARRVVNAGLEGGKGGL